MPTIAGKTSLAANTASENVIAQSPYEFVAVPSRVVLAATCDKDDVVCDFQLGGETLTQRALVKILEATVTGRSHSPDFDEDLLSAAGGDPGERIYVNFLNTGAQAAVVRWIVGIFP